MMQMHIYVTMSAHVDVGKANSKMDAVDHWRGPL